MQIFSTMFKLFVSLIMGYYFCRRGILDDETNGKISQIILKLTMPCMILASVGAQDPETSSLDSHAVFRLLLAGVAFYCVMIPVSYLLVRLARTPKNLRGTSMAFYIFPNAVFMGYPVVSSILGAEGIFYTTVFHLTFNVFYFTIGLYLMERDAQPGKRFTGGSFFTPGLFASVLAIVFYFAGYSFPAPLQATFSFIGQITAPMSLLVIGAGLAGYSFRQIFATPKYYLISAIRLIVLPVLAVLFTRLFLQNYVALKVVALTVGMPVASAVAMGSASLKEQGPYAAQVVGLTTLLSMLTIPFWLWLVH